ncbi:MAG: MerR family transcriptional regulator [Beijerinckiaceae bacterium]
MDKSSEAFRTITEVAESLDLPQHVLRFWETRFTQIKPLKRAGGRRYYRPEDVQLITAIRRLLYDEGFTIRGVQRLLREHGAKGLIANAAGRTSPPAEDIAARGRGRVDDAADDESSRSQPASPSATFGAHERQLLQSALHEIVECQRVLDALRQPSN